MNGHLATVCNGFTNSFLPRQACSSSGTNTYYWIGRSYDVGGDGWSLTDGSNCSYSNWASGEPHLSNGASCVALSLWNAKWYAPDCNTYKSYVCKVPASAEHAPPTCPAPKGPTCESGWTYYQPEEKCYKVVRQLNFYDTLSDCQNAGGTLASVHSATQNSFFTDLAFANGLNLFVDVWIGLHDPYHTRQWKWTDGSSVDFINWNPGEPNNVNGTEFCVMMVVGTGPTDGNYGSKSFGKWNDIKCDAVPFGGICQRSALV